VWNAHCHEVITKRRVLEVDALVARVHSFLDRCIGERTIARAEEPPFDPMLMHRVRRMHSRISSSNGEDQVNESTIGVRKEDCGIERSNLAWLEEKRSEVILGLMPRVSYW
jgi:hypothetical protein